MLINCSPTQSPQVAGLQIPEPQRGRESGHPAEADPGWRAAAPLRPEAPGSLFVFGGKGAGCPLQVACFADALRHENA